MGCGNSTTAVHQPQRVRVRAGKPPLPLKKLDKLAATLTYPKAQSDVEKCEEHYWAYGEDRRGRLDLSSGSAYGFHAAFKDLKTNQENYVTRSAAQSATEREKNTRARHRAEGVRPPPLQKLDNLAVTLTYPEAQSDVEKCEQYYWKYGEGSGGRLDLSSGAAYDFHNALRHLKKFQENNTRARQKAEAYYEDIYLV